MLFSQTYPYGNYEAHWLSELDRLHDLLSSRGIQTRFSYSKRWLKIAQKAICNYPRSLILISSALISNDIYIYLYTYIDCESLVTLSQVRWPSMNRTSKYQHLSSMAFA